MKLSTYQIVGSGRVFAGVVEHATVRRFVVPGDETADPLKSLLATEKPLSEFLSSDETPLDDVRLLAPVRRPDKFICVGLNYASHAREAGMDVPAVPTFFVKLPNAIIGPDDPILIPDVSNRIDWEGELAVVIGRTARAVEQDHAMDYVAGYTITNDVTARDYQFKTSQWNLGKTFDTFAPIGPWITTLDEIPNPHNIHLQTRVNGETVQDAYTSDLIFGVAELVSFFSNIMTLVPGDIIATGTPSGIGAMMNPRRWLRDGDKVTISIEHVGQLSNVVRGRG